MLSWLTCARAATWTVGPSAEFSTIQDAVAAAASGDRIEVQPGDYTGPVELGAWELELVGVGGASGTRIVASAGEAALVVGGPAAIALGGFTLDGAGRVPGAILRNYADLTLDGVAFQGAGPTDFGGDLRVADSTLRVIRSTFDQPAAVLLGGGHAFFERSTVTFEDTSFSQGVAEGDPSSAGGAIHGVDVELLCLRCSFTANRANQGGAVKIDLARDVRFEDSVFLDNHAAGEDAWGGAMQQYGGELIVVRSRFEGNQADQGSGGIDCNEADRFELADSELIDSYSGIGGGVGVYQSIDVSIHNNRFIDGEVWSSGADLALAFNQSFDIAGNTFCNGTSGNSGSTVLEGSDTRVGLAGTLRNNAFLGTRAIDGGTVLGLVWGEFDILQNVFLDTRSSQGGGVLWVDEDASARLVNNVFVGNEVGIVGGEGEAVSSYGVFWDNVPDPIVEDQISADPVFRSYTAGDCDPDLRPGEGSALIDAGDPELLDDDGSRSDVGMFGGPGASEILDIDGDGEIALDCAPFDPDLSAEGIEIVADGVDQDCDGLDLCHVDEDGDGAGGETTRPGALGCAEEGLAPAADDCDDGDPSVSGDCSPGGGGGGVDLPPTWFCSQSGPPPGPGAALLAGLVGLALIGRRAGRPAS